MKCTLQLALIAFLNIVCASAFGAGSSSAITEGFKMVTRVRAALGYGFSNVSDVKPTTVQGFDKPNTYWQEADVLMPLSLHIGVRESIDDSASIDFSGNGAKPGELYLTAFSIGAKLTWPAYIIQPWAGAGVVGGFLAVSDPTNRGSHNIGVVLDRESNVIRGAYWHAGIDIMFGEMGLRAGYRMESIETDNYTNLNGSKVEFTHGITNVGFVTYVN